MARRKDGAGKKKVPEKKVAREERWGATERAHFYAQGNPICQLLEDRELGWKTIGECFFDFFQKYKDGEEK